MTGLDWQTIQFPFAGGLSQKGNVHQTNPPSLDVAVDVEFDAVGGLRTRYPSAVLGNAIDGGGTLANVRRLADNAGELLAFTVDTLYSWSPAKQTWLARGPHLAVTVDEQGIAQTTDDQYDCDSATLGGITVYTWTAFNAAQNAASGFIAAYDAVTGAAVLAPTALPGGWVTTTTMARLVPVATKILLFYNQTLGNLNVLSLDPANLATSLAASPTIVAVTTHLQYDVVPTATGALGVAVTGASTYAAFAVSEAAALTLSVTKSRASSTIACSLAPDGVHLQVVRSSASAITGDLLLVSTLADVFTNQAIGTVAIAPDQIACAHRTVQTGGHYRCYVWWSLTNGGQHSAGQNWVDDGGTLGTATTWAGYTGIASRAFDHAGSTYVWGVFAENNETTWSMFGARLQNVYVLWRDDGLLVAKATSGNAGGLAATSSHLPGVQLVVAATGYAWAGTSRRIINLNGSVGYAERAPRAVSFTFDDPAARRCARLGATLYVAGGLILAYDGEQLVEVGWVVTPWAYLASALGSGGNLSAGGYGIKSTWRWDGAAGEYDRSTSSNIGTVTTVANDTIEYLAIKSLTLSRKPGVAVEAWRTVVNPLNGSPFFLETSKNPAVATNPNRYLTNIPTGATPTTAALTDTLSDTALSQLEDNPENGAVLPNIQPPGARVIAATDTRVFLAGVAGAPDTVWYSQYRQDGRVVAFNDALIFQAPSKQSPITAIGFLNGAVVVFRGTATYLFTGDGFDNTGGGANYALSRVIANDVGALSQEAVTLTDQGLVFKSAKGWRLLDLGFELHDIGTAVANYDSEAIVGTHATTLQRQVRASSGARELIYDTLVQQWGEWSIGSAYGDPATASAIGWNGTETYTDGTQVYVQLTTYAGVTYGPDVEISWWKPADLQGFARCRKVALLGLWRSTHQLRIRVAYDYASDGAGGWAYTDDFVWTPSSPSAGAPEQVRFGLTQQRFQAIKIRVTAVGNDGVSAPTAGASLELSGIAFEVGIKVGINRRLSSAQKD